MCVPLPVCACEGGNREEARMVGWLLVLRDLGAAGDREGPGVSSEPAGVHFQGLGNSGPSEDAPLLSLIVIT